MPKNVTNIQSIRIGFNRHTAAYRQHFSSCYNSTDDFMAKSWNIEFQIVVLKICKRTDFGADLIHFVNSKVWAYIM